MVAFAGALFIAMVMAMAFGTHSKFYQTEVIKCSLPPFKFYYTG